MSNNLEGVRLLLDAGADIDMQDGNGRTAIMQAISDGKQEIIDLLFPESQIWS